MASRKTKKKNLIQFLGLLVAVAIVVVASVAFQNWWKNRPGTLPQDVSIKATTNTGQELEFFPFSMCEPGVECPENELPIIDVTGADTLTLTIPEDIYDHDWSLLTIYDQAAASSDYYYSANEKTESEIPITLDKLEDGTTPRLMVVEVASVMIGQDDNGEETPYTVTWSLSTNLAHE